eukprot:6182519-Pleurochrysis_carterae.AAC.5
MRVCTYARGAPGLRRSSADEGGAPLTMGHVLREVRLMTCAGYGREGDGGGDGGDHTADDDFDDDDDDDDGWWWWWWWWWCRC